MLKSLFAQPPDATLILRPDQVGRGDAITLLLQLSAKGRCEIERIEATLVCQRTTPDPTNPRAPSTETLFTRTYPISGALSLSSGETRLVETRVLVPEDAMASTEMGGYQIRWGVVAQVHLKKKSEPLQVSGNLKVLDLDPKEKVVPKKRPSIREALEKLKERQEGSRGGSFVSSPAARPMPAAARPAAPAAGAAPSSSGDVTNLDLLPKGTILNYKYEIVDKLGQGGMGVVYKAVELGPNRAVALKVLSPALVSDEEATKRFFREAETYFALKDPNIVRLIDSGFDQNLHYIAMEFVEGKDLMEWALADAKGLPDLLEKLKDVVRGLAHAHQAGIIHRDLKPENIMVTTDGRVKVMDFGLARKLEETTRLTATGTVMGTVAYMPPEQATGAGVDETSDIYSLGCMMYELCTGQVPFDTNDPIAAIFKHVSEIPVSPRDINPHIPEALEAAIMRCLEKQKEDRFPSATELLAALEAVKII